MTGLEHVLNNDSDTLSALSAVAKERGKGTFAKGLKIAITPEGSGKELRLIPPDKEALQAWLAQNPDKSVADLVHTAIDVLKESRDSGFDLDKINNELASLKGAISDIDAKIKKKPFTRAQGGETFERLDYPHKFRIRADQGNTSVKATLDPPKVQKATSEDTTQVSPHIDNKPARRTADYIVAKVLGNLEGEQYGSIGDVLSDIRLLSGNRAQLDKLLGYMKQAEASETDIPLLHGNKQAITEYIQSLSDNQVPSLVNQTIRTDIQTKN